VRQGFFPRSCGQISSEAARGKYVFEAWFSLVCNLELPDKLLGRDAGFAPYNLARVERALSVILTWYSGI
jgi:hypothetical protein